MRLVYALLGIIIAGVSALILHLSRPAERVVVGTSPVDSVRVGEVRDSLDSGWADARRRFHNLQTWIDAAPADTVWRIARRLVRDTVDTGRIDTLRLVSQLVLDDSACHLERDSMIGEVMLWKARDAAHAEALALCQRSLGGTPAPSDGGTTWTVSGVLQADGEALRPGLGLDWRQGRLSVGAEGYVQRDGMRPGVGVRFGFNW